MQTVKKQLPPYAVELAEKIAPLYYILKNCDAVDQNNKPALLATLEDFSHKKGGLISVIQFKSELIDLIRYLKSRARYETLTALKNELQYRIKYDLDGMLRDLKTMKSYDPALAGDFIKACFKHMGNKIQA